MHDVGKPRTRRFEDDGAVTFHHHDVVGAKLTRKRMQALRFAKRRRSTRSPGWSSCTCASTATATGEWTDSAVRRYVRDAGDQLLPRLHVLTRADCTTRNQRKADRLRAHLRRPRGADRRGCSRQEELAAIRPDLDGNQIMADPRHPPGPGGRARPTSYLLELRLDEGPIGKDAARERLLTWWAAAARVPEG